MDNMELYITPGQRSPYRLWPAALAKRVSIRFSSYNLLNANFTTPEDSIVFLTISPCVK